MSDVLSSLYNQVQLKDITGFYSHTDFRDGITKMIQEVSRTLSVFISGKPELTARFKALYSGASDARKIFRFGRFITDYVKLKDLFCKFTNSKEFDETKLYQMAATTCLIFSSIFESLTILSKLKVIKGNTSFFSRRMCDFIVISVILNILIEHKNLSSLQQKRSEKKKSGEKPDEAFQSQIKAKYILLFRFFCDLWSLSKASYITNSLQSFNPSEKSIAIAALCSAAISTKMQIGAYKSMSR